MTFLWHIYDQCVDEYKVYHFLKDRYITVRTIFFLFKFKRQYIYQIKLSINWGIFLYKNYEIIETSEKNLICIKAPA